MFLGKNIESASTLPENTGVKSLDDLARKYNVEKLKGNIQSAMVFFLERAQLQTELQEATARITNVKEEKEEIILPVEVVEVSAVIQDLYDKWSDEIKTKVGMTVQDLQTEFNNEGVRAGADEIQFMNTKWNNCK